jgi:hypothetical protein
MWPIKGKAEKGGRTSAGTQYIHPSSPEPTSPHMYQHGTAASRWQPAAIYTDSDKKVVSPSRLPPISLLPLFCANFSFSCSPDELYELTTTQQQSSPSHLPLSQSSIRRIRGSDHFISSTHYLPLSLPTTLPLDERQSPRSRVIIKNNQVSSLTKRQPVITLSKRCWLRAAAPSKRIRLPSHRDPTCPPPARSPWHIMTTSSNGPSTPRRPRLSSLPIIP